MTKLKKLSIEHCFQLSGKGLEHLTKLSCLTELNVKNSNVLTAAGIAHLAQMIELTSLSAGGFCKWNIWCVHDPDNEVPRALCNMTRMTRLTLDETKISDDGLAHLEHMTCMTKLSLRNTLITDGGLVKLGNMKRLEILNVAWTHVTKEGVLTKLGQTKRFTPLTVIGRTKYISCLTACQYDYKNTEYFRVTLAM